MTRGVSQNRPGYICICLSVVEERHGEEGAEGRRSDKHKVIYQMSENVQAKLTLG